jgi:hypothetical protein
MNKIIFVIVIILILIYSSRVETYFGGYKKPSEVVLPETGIDLSKYRENDSLMSLTNDLMQEIILQTNKEIYRKTKLCSYIIETVKVKSYIHKENLTPVYRFMFIAVKYGGFPFGFAVSTDIRVLNEGPRIELREIEDQKYIDNDSKNQFSDNIIDIAEEYIEDKIQNETKLNEIEKIRLKRDMKNLEILKTAKRVKIVDKPSVAVLSLSTQPLHVIPPSDDKMSVFTNPSLTKEFVDYTGVRQAELDMIKINRFVDKKILDSQTMYGDKTRDLNIL